MLKLNDWIFTYDVLFSDDFKPLVEFLARGFLHVQIYLITKRSDDNGKTVTLKLTYFGSVEYWMGIHLRNNLLKKTSGKELIQELPLEEKDNWHIVVLNNDEVVGTLMLSRKSKKTAQIEQVAICEGMQGQGVGQKLIAFAEDLAQELGFEQVFLTGRESAWRFYEKLGYQTNHKQYKIGRVQIKEFTKVLEIKEKVKEMETNG